MANSERLLHIQYINGGYILTRFKNILSGFNDTFLVVDSLRTIIKENTNFGYKLKKNTIIKLGKTKLIVKEISNGCKYNKIKRHNSNELLLFELDQGNECRICKDSSSTPYNPLIFPCKCSGSTGYVHVNCMKAWYDRKMECEIKSEVTTYTINGFECELCREEFSLTHSHYGKPFDLLNINRPNNEPYVLLESFSEENPKQIFLVKLNTSNPITIVILIKIIGKNE